MKKEEVKMLMKIILFLWLSLFSSIYSEQKKVFICFKSGYDLKYYYIHHHTFFQELFGPTFEIIPGNSLKNIQAKKFDFIISDEVPKKEDDIALLKKLPKDKLLLFTFEPPLSEWRSNDKKYHQYYSKIFTWNDDLIDNKVYFKVRFPWMDPRSMVDGPSFQNRKLCVFVGNNYHAKAPCENYSNRRKIVNYFENKNSNDFDFYGHSWPEGLKNHLGRIPNGDDRRLAKINVIKNYKFDICYENVKDLNGWLSERIFESFAAGCIPIYLGSKNIANYIPESCFISRNQFKSNDELYQFMKNMNELTYNEYIHNIRKYLESDEAYRVSTAYYIKEIRKVLNID